MSYKPTLTISAPCSSRSGYGDHARDIVYSLIKQDKYDISILDQRWGNCPRTELSRHPEIESLVVRELHSHPDIWIQVTVANEFQKIGKHYNIGITAGIETDRVAPAWIEGVNRMDLVLVPSEHAKDVFENTEYTAKKDGQEVRLKTTTPVEVVFEGLDLDVYNGKAKSEDVNAFMSTIKQDFVFLFVGHWLKGDFGHDRKDIARLLKVFAATFKDKSSRNKPALILKTGKAGFSRVDEHELIKAVNDILGDANVPVYILHGDLAPGEMAALYNHPKVKSMVSFTKGEGFGRPLLEFSATGKPTIASGWSGHVDFLKNHGTLLPGELTEVHTSAVDKGLIEAGSKWFCVDHQSAHDALRDVHKNYKKHLTKSKKQKAFVAKNFSLDKMDKVMSKVMSEYLPNIPEPVKLKLPELKLPKLEKV